MYVRNEKGNRVTYFKSEKAEELSTAKMFVGKVSEGVPSGKDANGKTTYEYEWWTARFVGEAREKALTLEDKTPINLIEFSAHNPYNKEKKQSFPYLLVTKFEVLEKK